MYDLTIYLLIWPPVNVPGCPGRNAVPVCVPLIGVGTTSGIRVVVCPGDGETTGAGVGYLLQSCTRQQPSLGSAFKVQDFGKFV
jgi:hypothetical protein